MKLTPAEPVPWSLCHASLLLAGALCTLTWSHQLPPPLGKSLWGCFSSGRQIQLLWPPFQLAMPSHTGGTTENLSFSHVLFLALHPMANKGERGHKEQGRENGNKGDMHFPSSIWNLFYTSHFEKNWPISYSFTLTGFLGLIKKNHNLKETKVAIRFFSLKSQSRFKEELL